MGEYDDDRLVATRRGHRSGRGRPQRRGPSRRRGSGRRVRLLHDVGVRRWRTAATVPVRDVERVHPVMQASRVPRTRLRPGAVVLARVRYEPEGPDPVEGPETPRDKVRPVVVVRVVGDGCVCRPCTSAVSRLRYPWRYTEIEDLTAAGLSRPTGVRRREVTLALDAYIDVCGVLSEHDLANVLDAAAPPAREPVS